MRSEWPNVHAAVGSLPSPMTPMRSYSRYWIADPTGVPHIVPGSSATQRYWGSKYDISTANPDFKPPPLQAGAAAAWSTSDGLDRSKCCCYRCLTYQRSTVSVCPFQDRVNCQQPGDGATISEG